MAEVVTTSPMAVPLPVRRWHADSLIKAFFGSNALIAIVVLALITIFLFREGFGFFGKNLANIRLYRRAGLEYVDILRDSANSHAALSRSLNDIRKRAAATESADTLSRFDEFSTAFSDSAENLNGLVSDAGDKAVALRDALALLIGDVDHSGENSEQGAATPPIDEAGTIAALRANTATFATTAAALDRTIRDLLKTAPSFQDAITKRAFEYWTKKVDGYLASLPATTKKLQAWNPERPVPAYRAVTSFLFGRDWITASFWQDWYGIIPLFVGSFLVSIVALAIAVPFGVASAIYVSEVAQPAEKRFIKPYVEFIAAIPSVVLGFFGIAVVGQTIRHVSQSSFFHWVSFFPISERLNIFTAGSLLALMAVSTIFTLAEDALRNVPRGFVEASYALGANRLQTVGRVIVPASLSGIVSAILLGFGRVIGETMVVLLCAGNRIAIPDFTQGLGAFFQPVHTMTGIIAQEMGEVVRGSIHYRALFMVGLALFAITLATNYAAQKLVARYRMSIG
ncbi:MAG: phosphate ABC transporter permease subunit PstC [Verrucomicrobia bacterium]|nr:MAG: phosphate ABC transporter permease subunit PstC [Verrucomicrobiota bacterium]